MSFSVIADDNKKPYVVSTNEYVKIYFPYEVKKEYEWYKESVKENHPEYIFSIKTRLIEAGFYLYKYPGAIRKSGGFNELLSQGQKSVWANNTDFLETHSYHSIDLYYEKPNFVISVTNPETIKALKRSPDAFFIIHGFDVKNKNVSIEIQ